MPRVVSAIRWVGWLVSEDELTWIAGQARRAIVAITSGLVTLLCLLWLGSVTGWGGW